MQHAKLFTLITDLEARQGDAATLKVRNCPSCLQLHYSVYGSKARCELQTLVDFVVLHFKTEEDGFSAHHYKHEVEHKAIHNKFLADVTDAVKGGINPAIIAFLKDWLVTHIKGE